MGNTHPYFFHKYFSPSLKAAINTGYCCEYDIFIFRMLKVLQARPEDEILLKYWMTSLSRSYRSQLLNCQDSKENCF